MNDKKPYYVHCRKCQETHYLLLKEQDVNDWMDGKLIQNAFPYLSASQRELMISGICPSCWVELFGEDEE